MKKLLLASVATLALAAFAAGQAQAADATSGLKLSLGGYFSVQGAYATQSNGVTNGVAQPGNNKNNVGVFEYGELHFTAEKAFDNGLTAGYQAVLELPQNVRTSAATTTTGITTRQDYGYFSGNWGRFEAGQNYSPVYYMGLNAPSVNDEFDSIDPDFNLVNITPAAVGTQSAVANTLGVGNYATVGFTPFYHDGQNGLVSNKIVYYTPRFNGFQLGASFTPTDYGKNTETGNYNSAPGFTVNNTLNSQDDRAEAGLSYGGKFSGVGLKASGGYGHATLGGRTVNAATDAQLKDEQALIGGVQLSYMNWTLGGGYLWDNNGQSFKSGNLTADGESDVWNAGLGYAVGPYHAGVTYYDNETSVIHTTTATFKSNDKLQRWVVGGGYAVAPGVDLNTTLQFHKYDTADSAINASGNNNATVFTLGTTMNF